MSDALWKLKSSAVACRVSGKDARRYLHNRLSHDIRSLAPGESRIAAALTAQGRVEGLFTLFCEADDRFYLVCDGGSRQALFASLGRYVVADRVLLEDISSSICCVYVGAVGTSVKLALDGFLAEKQVFCAPSCRLTPEGTQLLVLNMQPVVFVQQATALWGAELADTAYDLARFAQAAPVYPDEVGDDVILTECKLKDVVSFSKGCYVGQEVIERSDAIGRVPRQLERIALQGSSAEVKTEDAVVGTDGAAIGKVVSAFSDSSKQKTFVFALLRTGKYAPGDAVRCGEFSGNVLSPEDVGQ